MIKRILSIFVYQCVVWLLYMLIVNPATMLFADHADTSLFSVIFIPILFVFSIASVIVYYIISSKIFSIEISTIKEVLAQIGFTLLVDVVIACIVVCAVCSTPKSPGFFDFRGVVESVFAIYNAVYFTLATIIIAVIRAVKRKASPRAYKITVLCTVVLFILCPVVKYSEGIYISWQRDQEYEQEQKEAEDSLTDMLVAKDAALPYQTNEIHSSGLMDTGYKTNMVFIDYDSKRIGFLYSAPYGEYQSFSLTEGSLAVKGYTIQKQWDLDEPGKKLTTYYADENHSRRTIGIELEMADQSVYSIDGLETSEEGYSYGELGMSGKGKRNHYDHRNRAL